MQSITQQNLIHVQMPQKKAEDIMKVLYSKLKEEEHFEAVHGHHSFRAELIRGIIKNIEK